MDLFLARFSDTLPAGVHAVLLLDQAGWHGQAALQVPANITLLPLPPYSPELNPVERVWLYLRERFLSFRLYQGEQAIVDALCAIAMRYVCARRSWRGPAGGRPVQVRGSARLVASVALRKATTATKRTQRLCGVGY